MSIEISLDYILVAPVKQLPNAKLSIFSDGTIDDWIPPNCYSKLAQSHFRVSPVKNHIPGSKIQVFIYIYIYIHIQVHLQKFEYREKVNFFL